MLLLLLGVLLAGIMLGARIAYATQDRDGVGILTFALLFLNTVMLIVLFTQLTHVKERLLAGRKR
jgi:hypothetical protein